MIKTSDMPGLQAGSPLKSIGSKTFMINEFKDISLRISDDPLVIKKAGVHTWKLEQPPETVVASVVRKELERNGHKCIAPSSAKKADYIIDGTIFKFYPTFLPQAFSIRYISEIAVKLTVSRIPASSGVFVKQYQGTYDAEEGHVAYLTKPVQQTLLNMIKEISTDQDLIEFLQK
jgi:hypothetical protein